jgi:hypothetical protein
LEFDIFRTLKDEKHFLPIEKMDLDDMNDLILVNFTPLINSNMPTIIDLGNQNYATFTNRDRILKAISACEMALPMNLAMERNRTMREDRKNKEKKTISSKSAHSSFELAGI